MISSYAEYRAYLAADLAAHNVDGTLDRWRWHHRITRPGLFFLRLLRQSEYVNNCYRGPFRSVICGLLKMRRKSAGTKLGFEISENIFGPGLRIPHIGAITVNGKAKVGANCTLHPCTLIGERNGAPVIGDDCYIGNGAKIYGPIEIGDGVRLGPNVVIFKSVPPGTRLVAPEAISLKSNKTVVDEATLEVLSRIEAANEAALVQERVRR
jgi:serine O-acetyltransferase